MCRCANSGSTIPDPDQLEADGGRRVGRQRVGVSERAGLPLRRAIHTFAVSTIRLGHGKNVALILAAVAVATQRLV